MRGISACGKVWDVVNGKRLGRVAKGQTLSYSRCLSKGRTKDSAHCGEMPQKPVLEVC